MSNSRLARAELAPLRAELVRRFERGEAPTRLRLRELPLASRRALADLLGADRLVGPDVSVPVAKLLAPLGLGDLGELRRALEEIHGSLADRRSERQATLAAREQLWSWLEAEAARIPLGDLRAWVGAQRAGGVRGGLARHRELLAAALDVLAALPADGRSLAVFAEERTGDPHALDPARPLTGLVLDAIAAARGVVRAPGAEAARDLWESVGVAPDPLSSSVLALGLTAAGQPQLAAWLRAASASSEPVVLTLSTLRRWPAPPLPDGSRVFVVENPSLVMEAMAGGWSGRAPLVCSSGRPTLATLTLIRQLTAGGARAFQHADFDPAGLAITAWLAERAGSIPWRMTSAAYRRALAEPTFPRPRATSPRPGATDPGPSPTSPRPSPTSPRPRLVGPVPATPWDPTLREAMAEAGVAVYEEQLRAELLAEMDE